MTGICLLTESFAPSGVGVPAFIARLIGHRAEFLQIVFKADD